MAGLRQSCTPQGPGPGKIGGEGDTRLDLTVCWVGSLDFHFLIEVKVGFPLNPKSETFRRGGSAATKSTDGFWGFTHSLNSSLKSLLVP